MRPVRIPRPPRADAASVIYHALKRGNDRQTPSHKNADYGAFERVLRDGLETHPVDRLAYQWIPNHWHMVLSPREHGAMSRLMYRTTMTHTARHHAHHDTVGEGYLYQGRYKSFPVQDDEHFLDVCRYVERNVLAAGPVGAAEDWRFGSLYHWNGGACGVKLSPWPTRWIAKVNQLLDEAHTKQLQKAIQRSQTF